MFIFRFRSWMFFVLLFVILSIVATIKMGTPIVANADRSTGPSATDVKAILKPTSTPQSVKQALANFQYSDTKNGNTEVLQFSTCRFLFKNDTFVSVSFQNKK